MTPSTRLVLALCAAVVTLAPARAAEPELLRILGEDKSFVIQTAKGPMTITRTMTPCAKNKGWLQPLVPVAGVHPVGEIEILHALNDKSAIVVDMREFFQKWKRAGNTFVGTATRNDAPALISPQSKKRKLADAAIECINCGVCYAACDVVSWDKDYLGPAALNRAWTLFNDERHADPKDVLNKATSGGGCNSCHSQGSCMQHCPVSLSPTGSIAGLKRNALLSFFKRG